MRKEITLDPSSFEVLRERPLATEPPPDFLITYGPPPETPRKAGRLQELWAKRLKVRELYQILPSDDLLVEELVLKAEIEAEERK